MHCAMYVHVSKSCTYVKEVLIKMSTLHHVYELVSQKGGGGNWGETASIHF